MKTLTHTLSHTARVRDLDMSIQEEVCLILGITDDFYCQDQYRAYEHFTLVCCSESHMNTVRFWINEWAQRNQAFLRMAYQTQSKIVNWMSQDGKAYDAYVWFHSTEELINDNKFMARFDNVVQIIRKLEGRSW